MAEQHTSVLSEEENYNFDEQDIAEDELVLWERTLNFKTSYKGVKEFIAHLSKNCAHGWHLIDFLRKLTHTEYMHFFNFLCTMPEHTRTQSFSLIASPDTKQVATASNQTTVNLPSMPENTDAPTAGTDGPSLQSHNSKRRKRKKRGAKAR